MSEYRFTVDRTNLEGKQGILTKGADGYYNDVLVGVWNVENSLGERYIFDKEIENMLDTGMQRSQLTKWLAEGKLIGEREHPHIQDFLSKDRDFALAKSLWIQRNAILRVDNQAHQFGGIRTQEMPDRVDGRRVYGVYAKLRPTIDALDASLSDKNANTAFSLRSYIRRIIQGAEIYRKCSNIFTYDWVNNNGIKECEKFNMPGLESMAMGVELTTRVIRDINELFEEESLILGQECSSGIITQVIKESGQWREVPSLTPTLCLGRQLSGVSRFI